MISKMSTFQFFPNLGLKGGGIKYLFFPKFKLVHIILGGGGKKVMDFFRNFGTFLVLNDSLCFPRLWAGAFKSESSGKRSVRNGMEHQARIVVVGTLVIYRLPSDVDYIMLRPGW